MAKEILLYTDLYSYTCERLITSLDENLKKEVTLRVNSPGGSVFAAWGVFAKVKEHGNVTMQVDGLAASGAGNLLLYAKKAKALNVSRIMLHRADGYASTPEQKQLLNDINTDLRKQIEMRVDNAKFVAVTGRSIEDMFNPETRIDIWLTAKQAQELNIVTEIVELKPEEIKAMSDVMFDISAKLEINAPEIKLEDTMTTIEELKSKYPDLYKSVVKAATDAERDRFGAWMAWYEIDPKAVKEGIDKGEMITAKASQEFQLKMMSPEYLKKLASDSAPKIATAAASGSGGAGGAATAAQQELADFEANIDKNLGKKPTVAAAAK